MAAGVVLFLAGAVGVFAWGGSAGAGEERRAEPIRAVHRAPVPKALREGMILVTSFNKDKPAELFKPDGTAIRKPAMGTANAPWKPRFSPDGKRALVVSLGPIPPNAGPWTPNHLHVLDLDSEEGSREAILSDLRYPSAVWSADGTRLYGSSIDSDKANDRPKPGDVIPLVSWVYNLKTKVRAPLDVPPGHGIVDLSPDGKTLLTIQTEFGDKLPTRAFLVPLATLKPRLLTDGTFSSQLGMRFSPDGKRIIGTMSLKPVAVTVADGSVKEVVLPKEAAGVYHVCWSPDGRRIAYVWEEEVPPPPGAKFPAGQPPPMWTATRVAVADPDGSNPKTIIRREHDQRIYGLDWH